MITGRKIIIRRISGVIMAAAALLLIVSLSVNSFRGSTDSAAKRAGKLLEERMHLLDSNISYALEAGRNEWIGNMSLPEDMVIYRYVDDSLTSWCNQFPVKNDDIRNRIVFQRLTRPHEGITSPLADITGEVSFVNYGMKWYLVKAENLGTRKVIAGLQIMDSSDEITPVNKNLRIGTRYTVNPLSWSGGSPVMLEGKPVFKVMNNASGSLFLAHSMLIWLAIGLTIAALFMHLGSRPRTKRFFFVLAALYLTIVATFIWGETIKDSSTLFSPLIYADGRFFNSLGSAFIWTLAIFLSIWSMFFIRNDIYRHILSWKHSKCGLAFFAAAAGAMMMGLLAYLHFLVKSIIFNSDITLELYKLNDLSRFSLLSYVMLLLVTMGFPLLFQMIMPPLKKLTGLKIDAFSPLSRALTAIFFAIMLVFGAGSFGFQKEQKQVGLWANRLSMERDISLELTLRTQEDKIASDQYIASFAAMKNSEYFIRSKVLDSYLSRLAQDYDIGIELFPDSEKTPETMAYFTGMVNNGTPIADNSRFRFHRSTDGSGLYVGGFAYYNPGSGLTMMLLSVAPKSSREEKGYSTILGFSAPGDVLIPARYSFAKYSSDKLTQFRGSYAYPTVLDQKVKNELTSAEGGVTRMNGYTHFVNIISEDEIIMISRTSTPNFNFLIAFLFTTLVIYSCLTLITLTRQRKKAKEKNYYKSSINAAMMVALIMTMIALAAVSVAFVNKRNNANLRSSMIGQINTLQNLLQARYRFAQDYGELSISQLDEVSEIMKADITLYNTGGKEILSTDPDLFERMLLESRIDQKAFENITFRNRRYYINKEFIGRHPAFILYAPVFNASGKMLAILSSPFTDESYDFKSEAVLHSVTVITVFLILLILARLILASAVDKMFKPLSEMGQKMNEASIDNLEYIIYERDDEVSTLVRAYNLMVHDLSNSTKQLTMSERDKAWATMARQVAHEIKNPLTPIKLQIQRLIRMKSNGNPRWMERFDEISVDILNQIDLLADTANEFSTFAKLYTEEPVDIDLDKLLKEEVDLFDSKETIRFSYMGLDGAKVRGPKPQLTRVFTNLIGNAVQAIENAQQEASKKNEDVPVGNILVSLRYSSREGFYDIVFEDNGPGVSEEHRNKLFTPNFTTKSNGTGLGLAICRNIIEKCNGEIFYSKSFTLKGACFTVRFPRS
jgi:Signal transduction histidine kinase involved in nitrogen fixation and metabolism regulation